MKKKKKRVSCCIIPSTSHIECRIKCAVKEGGEIVCSVSWSGYSSCSATSTSALRVGQCTTLTGVAG